MFVRRLKCSLKLVASLTIYYLPWCVVAAAIGLILRYLISKNTSVFDSLFRVGSYVNLIIVFVALMLVATLILACTKVDLPDTDRIGYRRFVRDKFRS